MLLADLMKMYEVLILGQSNLNVKKQKIQGKPLLFSCKCDILFCSKLFLPFLYILRYMKKLWMENKSVAVHFKPRQRQLVGLFVTVV